MKFEWDENKNRTNQAKHGIDFADAARGFLDQDRIEWPDERKNYGEIRYQTMSKINDLIIYVVYTRRADSYRIISARRENKYEQETYLQYQQSTKG
ncbi:BrnT family toxin [Candidatus Roizmanbacteria bacterium]|nr:BrnT family toxin [Candidatus Roizmanbacteria bacterium]